MNGGPCGGPDGVAGSTVLRGVGLGCLGLAGTGVWHVSRQFRGAHSDIRAWCVVSIVVAGLASLVGIAFTLLGGATLLESTTYR
jgi:hypothetical protein